MTDETKGPEKPKKKKDVDQLLSDVTSVTIGKAKPAPKAAAAAPAKVAAAEPAPAPKAEPAPKPAGPPKKIRLRQVRSGICTPIDQKDTLRGLGLTRLNQEVVRIDTPSLRGQVHKVRHLVTIVGEAS